MKKTLITIAITVLILTLTGCKKEEAKYKVGASPLPHAEILRQVQPILEEQGFAFEIVEFTGYILPNQALDSGEINANFFQHVPYLNAQIDEHGYDFINAGGVHIEPIGLYSKEYSSLEALPTDLELVISNSPSDRPRLFVVLEENGIITVNQNVSSEDITNSSIANLPTLFTSSKNISFIEVDSTLLFINYNNESGDAVLINGNYALDNGLNPLVDAIALEGSASLYVNILVCNTEDIDDPFIKALIEALQSEEIQNWIQTEYEGSVVPAAD